jgi:hypothetical protein
MFIEYRGNGTFLKFAQKILGTDKTYADTGTSNNSNPSSANSCSIADPSEFGMATPIQTTKLRASRLLNSTSGK